MMVGGDVPVAPVASHAPPQGAPVLALNDVHADGLEGVSLELRAGEILGIAGVDGNGQRELAEVVSGAGTMTSWPGVQLAGQATPLASAVCSASMTRTISSKLRPTLSG